MLIALNNKIYDTDKADVIDETERPQYGYFNETIEYKATDGETFFVQKSKFSNINDEVFSSRDKENPNMIQNYFDFDGYKNPENKYRIDEIIDEIEEIKANIGVNEAQIEDLEEKIKDLEEEIKELEDEQNDFENIIPDDAELIFECDNINMGASSSRDFKFDGYYLYKKENRFFIKNKDYENEYRAEVGQDTAEELLIYAFEKWDYKNGLRIIIEDFGWIETSDGVWERGIK